MDGVPEAGILKLVDLSGGVRPGEARVEVSIPLIKDFRSLQGIMLFV